jgi:putative NIF3 family GTP cyclohydrolase 1 type 2
VEVEVARWQLSTVVRALQEVHPYEEAAYDIYPVDQPYRRAGLGVVGSLPAKEPLREFLERVSTRLDAPALRYVGNLNAPVQRIAVCGGAGSDLIGAARGAEVDAYVTADLTYHRYFDVLSPDGTPSMALIDAGHYETEAVTEALLINRLGEQFNQVHWERTTVRTSPMDFFVHSSDEE